ncbi:MAG: tetratricopeptide repeat protein [Planctomycetaceae bacterium]|jgi:tetratricopeptide (TPR) repeat protein|nr:tetratricopeptide repeat protein [Planctomycetaceae bacterium]
MIQTSPLVLENKRIGLLGKLGAMTRKEACHWLKHYQATVSEKLTGELDLVIIGADELPDEDIQAMLNEKLRERIRQGDTVLVHEHDLWASLGLVDDPSAKQLYTPAMVASLIKTPVSAVRRWHRIGLLPSIKVAHKLPYFDFEQVQCAKQIAAWVKQGAKVTDLKKQLDDFGSRIANRSLIDLDIRIDGRRILLYDDGKLIGSQGQLHLNFDEPSEDQGASEEPSILVISSHGGQASLRGPREIQDQGPSTRDAMLAAAEELEDAGQIQEAIEWHRVILAKYGPNAEIVFGLGELLLRAGEVLAARERFYNAIEIDEDFVEARASLGCVLAETGQVDLAIAAFEGALAKDDHYPDVHYHLARSLDEIGNTQDATKHWLRFLQLSPQSPWADEALERLGRV